MAAARRPARRGAAHPGGNPRQQGAAVGAVPLLSGGATIAAESPFYDFTFFVKATRQQNVDNFFPPLSVVQFLLLRRGARVNFSRKAHGFFFFLLAV